jgi:sorbitol-specific phosphotransferase system component IIC
LQDFDFFVDALRSIFFLTIGCVIVIQFLAKYVGEERIEGFLMSAGSLLP